MKNWLVILLFSAASLMAWGQGIATQNIPNEASADAAHARIAAQRIELSQAFDQEDRGCLSRFAVTACQNDVSTRRRAVLADLRHQELVLNEVVRNEAGRARMVHLKEKAEENAAREIERAATPPEQTRQPAQLKKAPNTAVPELAPARENQKPKQVETLDPAVLAETRKAYAAKQEALTRRQQERDKRLQAPPKLGLPPPP